MKISFHNSISTGRQLEFFRSLNAGRRSSGTALSSSHGEQGRARSKLVAYGRI